MIWPLEGFFLVYWFFQSTGLVIYSLFKTIEAPITQINADLESNLILWQKSCRISGPSSVPIPESHGLKIKTEYIKIIILNSHYHFQPVKKNKYLATAWCSTFLSDFEYVKDDDNGYVTACKFFSVDSAGDILYFDTTDASHGENNIPIATN